MILPFFVNPLVRQTDSGPANPNRMATNWRVVARVLPDKRPAVGKGESTVWCSSGESGGVIAVGLSKEERYRFEIDEIFGPSTNQVDIYGAIVPVVEEVFGGKNASIFVYGVNGSGRKHTLIGETAGAELQAGLGLIPRAAQDLFQKMKTSNKNPLVKYKLAASIMAIKGGALHDKIHPNNKNLRAVESEGEEVNVPDLTTKYLNKMEDAIQLMKKAFFRTKKKKRKSAKPMDEHIIVTLIVEKWHRIDPTSPGVGNAGGYLDEEELKTNALGGSTPARAVSGMGRAGWRCKKSYLRFIKFIDMHATSDQENVSQTMSGFLRCVGGAQNKSVACRDSKLTFALKSCFTRRHMNVFIAQISQNSEHSLTNIVSTMKFASRVHQSVNSSNMKPPKSSSHLLHPTGSSIEETLYTRDSDGGRPGQAQRWAWVENGEIATPEETLVGSDKKASEATGALGVQTEPAIRPRPVMALDGLSGKISLKTPAQLKSFAIAENMMDDLETSIGSLPSPPASETSDAKIKELVGVAELTIAGLKGLDGSNMKEHLPSTLPAEDAEDADLEATLNAHIMSLKLGIGIGEANSTEKNKALPECGQESSAIEKGSPGIDDARKVVVATNFQGHGQGSPARSISENGGVEDETCATNQRVNKPVMDQHVPANDHKEPLAHTPIENELQSTIANRNILIEPSSTTPLGSDRHSGAIFDHHSGKSVEDLQHAQLGNLMEMRWTVDKLTTETNQRQDEADHKIFEQNKRMEYLMIKYREIDETAGMLLTENNELKLKLEYMSREYPPKEVVKAKFEQLAIAHREMVLENSRLQAELVQLTDVDMSSSQQASKEDFAEEVRKKETAEHALKLAKEEINALKRSQAEAKGQLEALEMAKEKELEGIAVLTAAVAQAKEETISMERQMRMEQQAFANERKAAKDAAAAYQAMERTLKNRECSTLDEVARRDAELEKLRIALSKAGDELRLASTRSSTLENRLKSEELGSAQMRQLISDSMNQLQAAHAAETARMQSMIVSLEHQLKSTRDRCQKSNTDLASAEVDIKNLASDLEIANVKLSGSEASLLETKKKWAEDITRIKVKHSTEVAALHTERESLITRLAEAHNERDEVTNKLLQIGTALDNEKTARKQSDLASHTYHLQYKRTDEQLSEMLREREERVNNLEEMLMTKEAELQKSIESRRKLFEQMEVLKSKMAMAMATNEKIVSNSTAAANAQMEANLKLLQEKQELELGEERAKMQVISLDKEVKRLKTQLHNIESAHGHVSNKLTEAMGKITMLHSSKLDESSGKKSRSARESTDMAEDVRKNLTIKNQVIELASCKREVDILKRDLLEARERNDKLNLEMRDLRMQVETLSHEKSKLKRSFERSQKALGQALSECRTLLNGT